jgi:hypothetical protein
MSETATWPGTYRHQASADVSADTLFAFVSELSNLPRYFPAITEATPRRGNEVHVEAVVHGRPVSGEAWMGTDPEERARRWGSECPNDYHGELRITPARAGSSELAITLHTTRAGGPSVDDGLRGAVLTLTRTAVADAASGHQ